MDFNSPWCVEQNSCEKPMDFYVQIPFFEIKSTKSTNPCCGYQQASHQCHHLWSAVMSSFPKKSRTIEAEDLDKNDSDKGFRPLMSKHLKLRPQKSEYQTCPRIWHDLVTYKSSIAIRHSWGVTRFELQPVGLLRTFSILQDNYENPSALKTQDLKRFFFRQVQRQVDPVFR